MANTRYTEGDTQSLLADVVELLATEAPAPLVLRRTYVRVLEAQIGDVLVAPATCASWRALTDEEVVELHRRVRNLMAFVLTLRAGSQVRALPKFSVSGVTLRPVRSGIEVAGGAFQMIALQVMSALRVVGSDRLAVCDCGRPFLKVGKRSLGCSTRCSKRVYMKKFRAGKGGRSAATTRKG
jgi:hypothetical protein